ncbi:MAG TPA: magnesium chelatase [Dehalococcoidia bacterium]|nr:magnesium chelatase [Dehalococcoidia bacterium]
MVAAKPKTLGELRSSGYKVQTVKQEMRRNLIDKMRKNEDVFPGIFGFEDTVIPQLQNAILSGQDIIFLGERGQAKSRIIRSLVNLLDDEIPVIQGSEVNDDPFNPLSKYAQDLVAEMGDQAPVEWVGRDRRYGEKLATPDITIADLIGEVDPIRVAEGRYLSDELTIHYGLIPRTNRGIFAINELPDLAERIQVGLFNIMEERDIQIRGYQIRLSLDVFLVSSANPEDYTNRGRIITPLKDRYGVQIRTHYPRAVEHEIGIMDQERMVFEDDDFKVVVPAFMKEIVAEVSRLARRSPDINQRSGVSVRASIANYESLLANAQRRAISVGESEVVPRVSDLPFVIPAIAGKVEFETVEDGKEEQILEKLIQGAILAVFNRYYSVSDFDELVTRFKAGISVEVGDMMPSANYEKMVKEVDGLTGHISKLEAKPSTAVTASIIEFILEGLHLNKRLNKDRVGPTVSYRG